MGQKTTTPKTATSKAAPAAAQPATPKYVLNDFAERIAKESAQMRASHTPTRARVDHENLGRLIVGFAGGPKSLQVSCPYWDPKANNVVKKGSYLIRTFTNTNPDAVADAVLPRLKKAGFVS